MQETRQHILEILREIGEATVDDIVAELRKRRGDITAVTVRHHLTRLQEDELITTPQLRHRATPGRPQHLYTLTEKARQFFPNNYQTLAEKLLDQIRVQLPPESANVIFEGVIHHMTQEADVSAIPFKERLVQVIDYLNKHGYNASWEETPEGYILRTRNCPYHSLALENHLLCGMDMRLISALLGVVPRLMSRVSDGDNNCAYLIPGT